MPQELSPYLTALDASFLYLERPTEALHIGSCMVYEGRMEVEELIRLLDERMHLVPRYRQRAVFPPLGASHPLWIDDPDFKIENHIEVVELDGPVDDRTLSEAAAQAYSGMLDRDRPLWSATIIHGLPDDNTAIVWKVHHAMIDGVSGVDLTMALNSLSPKTETPEPPEEPWEPAPLPDRLDLLQASIQHQLSESSKAWTNALFDLFRPVQMANRTSKMMDGMLASVGQLRPAPRTPFNNRVSGELHWAWSRFSFTEMRQIKNALGGTVNDLVLAILSGGIGKYLRNNDTETDGLILRAMCPVSMRKESEHGQLGNLVSVMVAPLFVGITDPAERHRAEQEAMDKLKKAGQAEALYEMTQTGDLIHPAFQNSLRLMPMLPQQRVFNTVSTNVPGPQIPLYQAGRKLVDWLPMGVVSNNIGLFVSILTYNGKITLGATVDRKQIEDPWELSEALYESYEELRQLAGVERESTPLDFDKRNRSEAASEGRITSRKSTTKRAKKRATKKRAAKKKATKKKATKKKVTKKMATKKKAAKKSTTRKKPSRKTAIPKAIKRQSSKKGSSKKRASSRKPG